MERIGKYQVKRFLGEGATSHVYLCFDDFNQRDVAVKLVKPEVLSDADTGHLFKKLFIAESSLAGKLTHPHIASILDSVNTEAQKFIVMEYVPGGTLERYARTDQLLPPEIVVEVVFKCSRALDFAYRIGVTHRDIKPANILAVVDGDHITEIKVTDFGAAIVASRDQTQVQGVGSPAYMSAEQIRDEILDHRTDIYSLGVVLYQLLTGHLPFEAPNNFSLIYQICNVDPVSPSTHRPGIPAQLERVVMKALKRNLEERYQSWDEFSIDLAELVRKKEIFASDPSQIKDSERFTLLRKLPFFADFSDVELWEVVRAGLWERVAGDQKLFEEGHAGDYFYILAEGQARVTKRGKLLNVVSSGECVGEMAYLASDPNLAVRSADVITMGSCATVGFTKQSLGTTSEACQHRFDRAFLRILSDRLALANQRLSA